MVFDPSGRRLTTKSEVETRVWDLQSGECVEVLPRSSEVSGIVAEATGAFAWRALSGGSETAETVIEPAAGGTDVAWYSLELENITTHPSGRIWAGSAGRRLYLIRLEGVAETGRE
jgi:hypothetical protein